VRLVEDAGEPRGLRPCRRRPVSEAAVELDPGPVDRLRLQQAEVVDHDAAVGQAGDGVLRVGLAVLHGVDARRDARAVPCVSVCGRIAVPDRLLPGSSTGMPFH
jgi:hypothetical protein